MATPLRACNRGYLAFGFQLRPNLASRAAILKSLTPVVAGANCLLVVAGADCSLPRRLAAIERVVSGAGTIAVGGLLFVRGAGTIALGVLLVVRGGVTKRGEARVILRPASVLQGPLLLPQSRRLLLLSWLLLLARQSGVRRLLPRLW